MVRELTEEQIDSGRAFVGRLDKRGLRPNAAFWFYLQDREAWSLVIGQDRLAKKGPRWLYGQLREVISDSQEELRGLSLEAVTLVAPSHPLVALLSSAISTGPGLVGVRLTNNVINGTPIEDAYIYRLWKG